MLKWIRCATVMLSLVCLVCTVSSHALAAAEGYVPGIKVVLEVRTPQGDLRSFQAPGGPPTYWSQDMPVVQGDKVTVTPMITTGGAELAAVRIRLDNAQISDRTEAPWRLEVDTAKLEPGYHMVEVWARTKDGGAKENSATATFLLVPQGDSLLRVLETGKPEGGPPVADEERLAATIRSRDTKVDEEIKAGSTATVGGPVLFYVAAGDLAKEFFYTLTRDGMVTYTSPRLPLPTHILLEPEKGTGEGQSAGTVILTVRAGDGAGRFGAPVWITVSTKPAEAAK